MYKFIIPILIFFCSCFHEGNESLELISNIRYIGDNNPQLALEKLDSISAYIIYEPLHSRMMFQLLRIRLQDKAYILPNSNKQIQEILPYFLENGTDREKQEALFYAGSVYRDLKDVPRSIDYFLKSMDAAEVAGTNCDSMLLRNTYSNLCYLFGCEHDNANTLVYARKEYELSSILDKYYMNSVLHMGEALLACDSIDSSLYYFDQVLHNLENEHPRDRETLSRLLYIYSHLRLNKADKCFDLLSVMDEPTEMSAQELFALGEYHRIKENVEEAIKYIKKILEHEDDLISEYDASRYLYLLYRNNDNKEKALYYSDLFVDICGELNLGKRQELAATVNNIYNYYRDKETEQKLIIENQAYHERNNRAILICVILATIGIAAVIYYRYCQIKRILRLKGKIDNIKKEKDNIVPESILRQSELIATKVELNQTMNRLSETREALNKTTEEINRMAEELRTKEIVLKEKIEQNKTIVSLMHQSEFEESAEEIIHALKKSGDGLKKLTEKEWSMLYYAVDKLWPMFKEQMCFKLGKVTDQQQQICYLMRAGFTPTQIQNMIGLSRTTMWRCTKKYEWIYSII